MRFTILRRFRRAFVFLGILGPGVVSAVAGDDAGGIGTYSVVGARFGYELLWVMVIITPLLAVVQEMVMRVSVVTGKGLSDLIREQFGVRTTALAMFTLLVANLGVTISEFVGIAAAAELLGVTRYFAVPAAAIFVWYVVARGNYKRAERVFLALSCVLLTYVISAIVVQPDWGQVAIGTLVPRIHFDTSSLLLVIAVIGTTISPYMQFTLSATIVDRAVQPDEYKSELIETLLGVLLSCGFAYFIIVATGATLNPHGITEIESADQAARALEPIAGGLAGQLFAIGLLGASLLAASILPLSTTFAICEAFGWERGVNNSWNDAPVFYGIYTTLIMIGALIALIPGVPIFLIFLLVYQLNGFLLPVLLVLMLRLANDRRLMGDHVNGRVANWLGWGTVVIIIVLTAMLFASPILQSLKLI
jgi:NRAMP (natural resistance-associated macrophage protein)-like metal ion transporter